MSAVVPQKTTLLESRLASVLETSGTATVQRVRGLAAELPRSPTRRGLLKLADQIARGKTADELIKTNRSLAWIATLESPVSLSRTASVLQRQDTNRSSLRRSRTRMVAYPLCVMGVGLALLLIACGTLLPQFEEMYTEFSLRLPWLTLWLLEVSRAVRQHPFAIVLGSLAVFAFCYFVLDGFLLRRQWTAALRHSIFPSRPASRSAVAEVASAINCLLAEGHSVPAATTIAAESCEEPMLAKGLLESLHGESDATQRLPANLQYALTSHHDSRLLGELSEIYQDVYVHHSRFAAFLFSQACLIFVGVAIAVIIVSLFLPLLSLVTSLA
ncbi:MAG: hypothetical protein AAGJ83_05815 [Planctomycetota bacterium]